jgi:acetolactate synthase I/II/III large subunit
MKASDLFVKCLETEGVTHIFGIPGEENADTMISLLDSKIKFVLCRHEQAAAFMADVYGRLTGKSGVCLGTLGPGATNLVTGVADANMDRAPLVCIIGQADTERLHKESHQNMDSVSMFKPITKWAQSIYHPDNIPEIVRKAFKVAETEKPGAVLIELPEDIADSASKAKPIKPRVTRRPGADHKAVSQAVDIITAAKKPLILAGNGAIRKRAAAQLKRLATNTGIGVVNTFMGKGAVPRTDEHCLFTVGLQGRDHILVAMRDADTIISVGYDLVEYAPAFWNNGREKKIVHIDFWPAEIDDDYQTTVDLAGDVADALWQVNEEIIKRARKKKKKLPLNNIKTRGKLRQTIQDDLEKEKNSRVFPMKPQKVLYDVRQVMGPDDILLSDVGAHKMWISRYYQCDEPNTCLISNGFCTMGFAFPGSIGAKIAMPKRKALSISGDAGFFMNAQDIETAVRWKLNVVAMVWMDGEYGLIKWKQQTAFDGKHSDLAFGNPDLEMWAKSYGAWGRTIESAAELVPALEEAFRQKGPAVIGVPIDYRENMKMSRRLGKIEFPI